MDFAVTRRLWRFHQIMGDADPVFEIRMVYINAGIDQRDGDASAGGEIVGLFDTEITNSELHLSIRIVITTHQRLEDVHSLN